MDDKQPILIIGNALGGLSVVRELRNLLPNEDLLYFGNSFESDRSTDQRTESLAAVIEYFLLHSPKHIVFACTAAAAVAMPALRARFAGISMSSGIDPAAKAAVAAAGAKEIPTIGIVADEASVRAKAFEKSIYQRRRARLLLLPAPLLAPIVEDGREAKDLLVQLAVEQYLQPLLEREIDVLVLGSAHHSIIKSAFEERLEDIPLIDSAEQCAQDVARRLASGRKLRAESTGGSLQCFVTANPSRLRWLAARSLGIAMAPPTIVSLEELYSRDTERRAMLASA